VTTPTIQLKRWTRAEFDKLAELCLFDKGERFELIDGEIYHMSPQSSRHAGVLILCELALRALITANLVLRVQLPLALSDDSEPEPDLAVVEGTPREQLKAHPKTALLVIEIAESSLEHDRQRKLSLYARSGIQEYWVVNLQEEVVEVYREPASGRYHSIFLRVPGDTISPLFCPQAAIAVAELLP
jgi:Uma2 family endonuclease